MDSPTRRAAALRPLAAGRVGPRFSSAGPAAATRIFLLHERLAAGRPVDLAALSRELEISVRTLKRDIERLRDFHAAPIAWERAARAYRYTAPFDLLTGLHLDADEALALVLAGRSFAAWAASPLGRTLSAAFGKIARFAGCAVSIPADDLRAALHQPDSDDPALDAEHRHFARLLDLVLARRETELVYQKPSSPRAERRLVRPLHLACLDHRWTLVAEDPARAGWRKFILSRIREVGPAGARFSPPPAEMIKQHLAGSLGRFTGEQLQEVRLRFDVVAAPYVRERPWHASQTLADLPDGAVEATLRLNNLIDVKRRILANGRHVEALAPPELRAALAEEIAALARAYAPEIAAGEKPAAPENKISPGHSVSRPAV